MKSNVMYRKIYSRANLARAGLKAAAVGLAVSGFFSAAITVIPTLVSPAYAQMPGTKDGKDKPSIPLSPAPAFGPQVQQGHPSAASAPSAAKPSAPATAPAAAPTASPATSSTQTSKPAAQSAETAQGTAARTAPGATASTGLAAGAIRTTPGGVKYEDRKLGTGETAVAGKTVTVHYTGWLLENGKLGKKFDSSLDRGEPFKFPLGGGRVIKGWDEGVAGMKVGGTRILTIPPTMGYGAKGAGNVIPPNATLVFEVRLLGV